MFVDIIKFEGVTLNKPNAPAEFISIDFHNENEIKINKNHAQSSLPLPFSKSECYNATITSAKEIIRGIDVKTVYEMELMIKDNYNDYQPGDTIGILPTNSDENVNFIIETLHYEHISDKPIVIKVKENCKKKLPIFLPDKCTIRQILKECIDLHFIPKKLLLVTMSEYTSNVNEKRFLDILASKEGATEYTTKILNTNRIFLDILRVCPSCKIPFNRLLEHMPRLLPRPYSIANSPTKSTIKILFSVNTPAGLTTGNLENISKKIIDNNFCPEIQQIPIYFRQGNQFQLKKDDLLCPIILIAVGTGIAPFLGFLEYREEQLKLGSELAECWLFFGCRYKQANCIYRNQLEEYVKRRTLTKFSEAFSRDDDSICKYVQNQIDLKKIEFIEMFLKSNAKVYVCGSKQMADDVMETIKQCLVDVANFKSDDALSMLMETKKQGRYLEDIWI